MNAFEFVKEKGIEVAKDVVADYPYAPTFYNGSMDDLKRIVESHELVEKCGGLRKVKDHIKQGNVYRFEEKPLMVQAISDVEACQ